LENTSRKASDILLNLETKIESLTKIISAQELNIRILSNKLNALMQSIDKMVVAPKISVETAFAPIPTVSMFQSNPILDPERQIPILSEGSLPLEISPQGFRRSSRPETFQGDDSYLKKPETLVKFPVQIPDVVVPVQATIKQPVAPQTTHTKATKQIRDTQNIPVEQRIVDKNGKSVFLANVEITNNDTGVEVSKTRTNGTGKWMASLPVGTYKVIVRKGESLTKEKVESVQDVIVDGTTSPLTLRTMIIM
jgi:hypothetical protein